MKGLFDPVFACAMVLSLGGCGAASEPAAARTPQSAGAAPAPARIALSPTVVTPDSARGIDEWFSEGQRAFAEQRWKDAATAFGRVKQADPEGPLATRAAFHAAWALDNAAEHRGALEGYQWVVDHSDDDLGLEAAVRALRLLLYLDEYERAGDLADRALRRAKALGDVRTVVVMTAKALSLLAAAEPERARPFIERARAIVERLGLDRAGRVHRDVAQVYFALGELRRIRSEAIELPSDVQAFPVALEARCQLLLDAQSAYSGAMRAHDAHWSAKAGYRVGQLYQKLHADLMSMPRPSAAASGERAELFEGAMRLRYAILLEKGLRMMDHTLAMAERTGEASEWVDRAREAKSAIEQAVEKERAAIQALPYKRAELERALDDLARRARQRQAEDRRSGSEGR